MGWRDSRSEKTSFGKPEVVRVWLLGGFSVSVGSRTIDEYEWRLKKARSLVKLLALAPDHRMHRERVMDVLWPGLEAGAAANNLRGALHAARRAFGSASTWSHLRLRNEELALCPDGALWVDVDAFEEAAVTARRTREPAAYRAAIEFYSGELLPEDRYEAWAENRREGLREMYLVLLLELAMLHEEREEYEPGIEVSRQALSEEPTREGAHTGLMRLYALSGKRREALKQYRSLSEVLSRELGVEPEASASRLHQEILSGRFPPVHPTSEGRLSEELSGTGPHNLPAARGSFVGRERDVVEVKRLLAMTDLLTLTGTGGSGKTRLALEVARELAGAYPDGVWLVELAGLSEGELLVQAVATPLKVREQPGRDLSSTLVEALREKKMLLVLDNCEHLVEAAAQLVDALLSSCPRLKVLATSREPLNVAGEVNWRVPPLSVPDPHLLPGPGDLCRYGAIRLFVERARLKLPTFEVTPANARTVAEVCRKLDGLPLAIELASARVTTLAVEQVAQRLEDSLGLLTGGARTAAPRHQTIRATLEWSYQLLEEAEKKLFGRLSVFAGGWTLEAAEAVGAVGDIEEGDVLDLLSQLVDKSLVVAEAGERGALRYRMLQPVRQYAREKLKESEEAEGTYKRHAERFLALAREAERELGGPNQALWLDRLETEHDNLRAALQWSLDAAKMAAHPEEAELGLRLAVALWLFWYTRGYLSEGREWLEKAALAGGTRALRLRAWALCNAGSLTMRQGDLGAGKGLVEEALRLFREMEDKEGIVSALTLLGIAAMLGQQDLESVPALYEEAASLRPQIKDQRTVAYFTLFSGIIAVDGGDWGRAEALHEEALEVFRELRDKPGTSTCLTNLGLISLAKPEYPKAVALLRENLRVVPESDKASILHNFVGLACAASAQGQPARAARLWGAADAVHEATGIQITPITRSRISHGEHMSAARSRLGEAAFEAAWAEGKVMAHAEAVRFALGDVDPAPREIPLPVVPESEEGLSNTRAKALNGAGSLAIFQGEYGVAEALLTEALDLFRQLGDVEGTATALADLGMALAHGGQEKRAVALRGEAEALRRKPLSPRVLAHLLAFLGMATLCVRDYEQALALPEEALSLYRDLGDANGIVFSLTGLGMTALEAGDPDRASTYFRENLRLFQKVGHKMSIAYCLLGLAGVAGEQGQPAYAARLWGAAEALRNTIGMNLSPFDHSHYDYEGRVAAARGLMNEEAWDAAWAEGEAMTEEEAVRFALRNTEPAPPEVLDQDGPPPTSGSDAGLDLMKAKALNGAGYLAVFQGEYEKAKGLLEEALALFRELEDREGIASSLAYLGVARVLAQQDLETVPALLEEATSLRPEIEDRHTIAMMLIVSGLLAVGLNDFEQAEADLEESLELFRDLRDSRGISMSTSNLGLLSLVQADYERATARLKENLRISRGPDYKAGTHYALFGLAGLAARQGRSTRAAKLWGAAETMRETFGIGLTPLARHRLDYEGDVATVRSQLGEPASEAAWAKGKAMTQERAMEYALETSEPASPEATPPAPRSSRILTRREEELAALVARELSNRRIAEELSISERTVETHVRNALKKLGLKSRFQLAERWSGSGQG